MRNLEDFEDIPAISKQDNDQFPAFQRKKIKTWSNFGKNEMRHLIP